MIEMVPPEPPPPPDLVRLASEVLKRAFMDTCELKKDGWRWINPATQPYCPDFADAHRFLMGETRALADWCEILDKDPATVTAYYCDLIASRRWTEPKTVDPDA
jgi:hypothetical protein